MMKARVVSGLLAVLTLLLPHAVFAQALQSPCDSQLCASNLQATQSAQTESSQSSPLQSAGKNPMDLSNQLGINLSGEFAPTDTGTTQLTGWIGLIFLVSSALALGAVIDWYMGGRLLARFRIRKQLPLAEETEVASEPELTDEQQDDVGKDTH